MVPAAVKHQGQRPTCTNCSQDINSYRHSRHYVGTGTRCTTTETIKRWWLVSQDQQAQGYPAPPTDSSICGGASTLCPHQHTRKSLSHGLYMKSCSIRPAPASLCWKTFPSHSSHIGNVCLLPKTGLRKGFVVT